MGEPANSRSTSLSKSGGAPLRGGVSASPAPLPSRLADRVKQQEAKRSGNRTARHVEQSRHSMDRSKSATASRATTTANTKGSTSSSTRRTGNVDGRTGAKSRQISVPASTATPTQEKQSTIERRHAPKKSEGAVAAPRSIMDDVSDFTGLRF